MQLVSKTFGYRRHESCSFLRVEEEIGTDVTVKAGVTTFRQKSWIPRSSFPD